MIVNVVECGVQCSVTLVIFAAPLQPFIDQFSSALINLLEAENADTLKRLQGISLID